MQTVILAEDAFEPSSWEEHEVTDVREFLRSRYAVFPDTARIYHGEVSTDRDVTPSDIASIERLGTLEGRIYVVIYPGDPLTLIVAVVAVLAVAAVIFLAPKIPNPTVRNTQSSSPNNELSSRSNQPRLNGRIPDIYGQVRSTPDLICSPYKVFVDNVEVEVAYMCVGRGSYEISDVRDDTTPIPQIAGAGVAVYGPGTSPNSGVPQLVLGNDIDQLFVATKRSNAVNGQTLNPAGYAGLYGNMRFKYPNQIILAEDSVKVFTDVVTATDRISIQAPAIIRPGFTPVVVGPNDAYFTSDGTIHFDTYDPTAQFSVDDVVALVSTPFSVFVDGGFEEVPGSPSFEPERGGSITTSTRSVTGTYVVKAVTGTTMRVGPSGSSPSVIWDWIDYYLEGATATQPATITDYGVGSLMSLNGVYPITSVTERLLTLSAPESVNASWEELDDFTDDMTPFVGTSAAKGDDSIIGPFIVEQDGLNQVMLNFVALNGLYKDDGENQIAGAVSLMVRAQKVDSGGSPEEGFLYSEVVTLVGSAVDRTSVARTVLIDIPEPGRYAVSVFRTTPKDTAFEGQVVDEVKWRDLYAVSPITQDDFGDVTTVFSVTRATDGALALKDRKLNMRVTRKVPVRTEGSTFGALTATRKMGDIICALCLDPFIGGRAPEELDFDNIYAIETEVETYFGTPEAAEFSYTFDKTNLSFEETISTVANAVFCTAYRRGDVIKLSFERATDDSTLLFNHRNKIPGSETRTVRFGMPDDVDGVEYSYVDPADDAVVTKYLPEDQSAVNPKKVESVGVRSHNQAHFHIHRIYNKLRFQNTTTEFVGLQQAEMLIRTDRILVADNTRSDSMDGEVIAQNGLELTLSQPVTVEGDLDHMIFLQHADGTVQAIELASIGAVEGDDTTKVVLSTAPSAALVIGLRAPVAYVIVANDAPRSSAFIVVEREPQGNFTSEVTAINYDGRYYQNDSDLI